MAEDGWQTFLDSLVSRLLSKGCVGRWMLNESPWIRGRAHSGIEAIAWCIFPVEDKDGHPIDAEGRILPNWYFETSNRFDLKIRSSQNLLEFERTPGHKTVGFFAMQQG